jgi:ComF family protein
MCCFDGVTRSMSKSAMTPAGFGYASQASRRVWRGLVDAVLPPRCLACGVATAEAASLCARCWLELTHITAPCCERLGTPFAYDEGEGTLSAAAIAEPPEWQRARAAVAYDAVSGKLVHALKYADRHEAGLVMARLMQHAGRDLIAGADAIVPIPLHRWRLWRRRYNQSGLLARKIATATGHPFRPELLERRHATPRQVGLSREDRRRNMRRAFAVPEAAIQEILDRRILLVDDVITTGATANAAAKALLKAGAGAVDVLAFALVLEPTHLHM